jgi:hypothetical protein
MYSQFHNEKKPSFLKKLGFSKFIFLNVYTFLMLLVLTTPTFAELVQIDTLVNTVNAPQSVFQVLRAGKKLNVIPMMVLQEGDWLCVRQPKNDVLKDEQNYVMLTFGNNQFDKVTFANSPYFVKKRGTTVSIPKNVIADTKNSWTEMFTHFLENVEVITRGDEQVALSIPLLTKYGEQQLIAGERALHLAWQGGNAPYWVQVFQGKAKKAFLMEMSYSKRVQFKKRLLNTGDYRVVVNDKDGQPIEGKFQVVESLPLPLKQVEQEMKASTMSESAKWTLFAAWLAQQDAFRFEAYQQTMGIAKEYQPALLIKNDLEKRE